MTKAEEFLAAAKILPVGEAALMVSFGDVIAPELLNCSRALTQALEENPFPGIYEFEASYTGVTIFIILWCWLPNQTCRKTRCCPRAFGRLPNGYGIYWTSWC